MILERTIELVKQIYQDSEISLPKLTKVVVGLGYTGVEISSPFSKPILGLASSLSSIINATDCSKIEYAGSITAKNLSELLDWACENPSLKKIIGIAALNAVSQHILRIMNSYHRLTQDLTDYLEINQNTKVTFIGLIKPLIRKVSKKTQKITIIEDSLSFPKEFSQFEITKSIDNLNREDIFTNLLFCSGTVLINDTFEEILGLFRSRTQKIILIGPSASMIPDVLFENGVHIVGGMEIVDPSSTLRVIQEGGGTKLFKQYGKKYNLINE